ncbi:phosphotransferase enzyme family-domain-containing protein [Staphylotrichum tortipilum]|uniref:Phosphotransferase enzyme family-domain-containing protein n=1 Tax=Staphylotrichum tortipilum TaxID=2831512 RepID=A0AAN6RVE9_9PEZI|nr:phosphotransferase enzyme family-domain-containing protein [Staphylotrichum longicolle]
MGSQLTAADFPIRISSTEHSKPPAPDLNRYWRSHEDEGYLERYWPEGESGHDAWITPIRAVLIRELPEFADAEIKYFAKGTFNRLYSLTNPAWGDKACIFRVSIPVEPFFKTESEMATMEYVRRHTTLPIPRVIAFSSSDDNELGYEWVLMEMMPGEPLRKLWPAMPDAARVAFFAELATHTKQLVALRFSQLGNIYFADVAHRVLPPRPASSPAKQTVSSDLTGTMDRDIGPGGNFVLGRIVSQEFFFDKRIYYPGSRGPFNTSRELIDMRLDLLGRRIQHLSPVEGTPWYCENDRELHRNKDRVDAIFSQFASLIPRLVPATNGPEDVGILWHDDLSEHNLLLDPVTYKLTAVVDWESVSVIPAYETQDARPAWLSDRDWRPTPLVQLARGVPPNDEWLVADKLRRVGEMGPSREAYHAIVGPVYDDSDPATRQRVKDKVGVAKQLEIATFQHRPWWTAAWIAENGFVDEPEKLRVGAVGTDVGTKGEAADDAGDKEDAAESKTRCGSETTAPLGDHFWEARV